jgi:hypothetical protein
MAVKPTHIGEALVAGMIQNLGDKFFDFLREQNSFCTDAIAQVPTRAITEAKLRPYNGINFDGASRVDVLVLLTAEKALPIEVKLGKTRLSKTRIDDNWLRVCGRSHDNARYTGNMMSILERKFPLGPHEDRLMAEVPGGNPVTLMKKWILIAPGEVVDEWKRPNGMPAFENASLLSFEDLVKVHGGREPFNRLVEKILPTDPYAEWGLNV